MFVLNMLPGVFFTIQTVNKFSRSVTQQSTNALLQMKYLLRYLLFSMESNAIIDHNILLMLLLLRERVI